MSDLSKALAMVIIALYILAIAVIRFIQWILSLDPAIHLVLILVVAAIIVRTLSTMSPDTNPATRERTPKPPQPESIEYDPENLDLDTTNLFGLDVEDQLGRVFIIRERITDDD